MSENLQNYSSNNLSSTSSLSNDLTVEDYLKQINTAETENNKTNVAFALILTKLDLINSKLSKNNNSQEKEIVKGKIQFINDEKINEQENKQLYKELEEYKNKIENSEKERNLYINELSKIKEDLQGLKNLNKIIIGEKCQLLNELKEYKIIKLEEENNYLNKQNEYLAKIEQLKLENENLVRNNLEKDKEINLLKKSKQNNNKYFFAPKITTPNFEQLNNQIRFVYSFNGIVRICDMNTCCENKCINNKLLYGVCINKNGYVNVNGNKLIYFWIKSEMEKKKKNNWIILFGNPFSKHGGYGATNTLFYFEVKMLNENYNEQIFNAATIGIDKTNAKIFLCNSSENWENYQKFEWTKGDIFGCGIVFPPRRNLITKPYVFFTKNGHKIVNKIIMENSNINFYPFVGLLCCSVETNFGEKPFIYNIERHT